MPMAHTAAMHMTWERGRPARIASPRARCPHSQPMFTSAVHAAPPHNAVMNIRLFLGGLRPPKPSQGPGPGCAGLRPASAEVWGNRISPSPLPRAYVHVSRPCASAAQRRNEHTVVPGRAQPSQTLPRVGHGETRFPHAPAGRGRGETRFPHPPLREPMFTSAVHAPPPHKAAMKISLFLGGLRPPKPSRGWGMGKPGFPMPLRGGGVGKPGFPTPLFESLCSPQPSMRLRHTKPQ